MRIAITGKKVEAIARMQAIGIAQDEIQRFEQKDCVRISEPPFCAFHWAEGEDLQRIRKFEEHHDTLVYLVIRNYIIFGKIDCYLYVSECRDKWESDRIDLKNGAPLCYIYNSDTPDYSRFGYIGIEKICAGGLCRTW